MSLIIFPTDTFANSTCSGEQEIKWDGIELKAGQIGRVTIQKSTTIYKNVNGSFEFWKNAKQGESFRVYANKETYFHLGGGLVIQNDAAILYETPSKEKLRPLDCNTSFTIGGPVQTTIGKVQKIIASNDQSSTSIHHTNYDQFYAISYLNNKITSIYTKDKNYQFNDISVTNTISQLEENLGTNYTTTGNTFPIEIITYHFPTYNANFFIDVHNDNTISAILLVENSSNLHPKKMNPLQVGYESLLFELINAERKFHHVPVLSYSTKVAQVARLHSIDMGNNDYFKHENLKEESPFDRLLKGGVAFTYAGENIAMGYTNAYFAHEALMNSLGHRKNIISTNYTEIGVGVHFAKWTNGFIPYYTENFIQP